MEGDEGDSYKVIHAESDLYSSVHCYWKPFSFCSNCLVRKGEERGAPRFSANSKEKNDGVVAVVVAAVVVVHLL